MNTIIAACVMAATLAVVVQAEDGLTGTWEGETRAGASIALNLTVKGTELTGTLVRDGQRSEISDGKVSKNTFTFKATLNEKTEALSGEVTGDELKIWLDRQGATNAIVMRRVKRK